METKRIILISGAPGTGKSTMRRLAPAYFRPRWGETAAFDTDEFYTFLDPDWATNERSRWYLAYDAALAMTRWLLQRAVTTVLLSSNGIFASADVDRALTSLHGVGQIYHLTLAADHATVVERVRQRGDLAQHPPDWLAAWQSHIRQHDAPWTTVIDTTARTPEAVLALIYEHCLDEQNALPAQLPASE